MSSAMSWVHHMGASHLSIIAHTCLEDNSLLANQQPLISTWLCLPDIAAVWLLYGCFKGLI